MYNISLSILLGVSLSLNIGLIYFCITLLKVNSATNGDRVFYQSLCNHYELKIAEHNNKINNLNNSKELH